MEKPNKSFNLLEEVRASEVGAVIMLSFLIVSFIKLSGEGGITGAAIGITGTSSDATVIDVVGGALLFSIIIMVYVIMIKNIKTKKAKQ